MREIYPSTPRSELAAAVNERFGTSFKPAQLICYVKNHKITCGRSGHFEKGNAPIYVNTKPNRTSFKKGQVPPNIRPLWSERICTKDGYILMKVPIANPYTGHKSRFVHKHRWIWEQNNGPTPPGHVIVFLDGDKMNCNLDNLRCVPRRALQYMNKTGLSKATGEARKSAILACEVMSQAFTLEKEIV